MTYQSEVLADSPVVYLELNETSGTAAVDQGSHAVNGTYQNGVTLNQSGMTGITPAAQFDGTNDLIDIPDHADLDITGDLTLEAWIYPTSYANWRMLITKVNGDTGPYQWLLHTGTGLPEFRHSTFSVINASAVPALNVWNHLAVTRSGTTVTHYLNGAVNGSGTVSGTVLANAEPVRIGRRLETDYYFVGKMMQVAIYNTALSQARLQAHIDSLPPPIVRVSQVGAEALVLPNPVARVSEVAAEALVAISPTVRVSQVGVEVLVPYRLSGGRPRVIWF